MNKSFSAVALKYPESYEAPLIVAKEKGLLAQKIIQIAKENNIPVVEDELTENILSVAEIGECIPYEAYAAVAGIFAMIKELEDEKNK